jgi:PAS domain S-box-containing protein
MQMNTTPLKLLIADDEAAHVDAICRAFKKAETNVEISVAGTLREYRERIATKQPHLAILDLRLPDGMAAEVLTHPPEDAPFPVLVMTAFGGPEIVVDVMKAGALDYIVKSPQAFAEMPETIKRVLREWRLLQEHKADEEALRWSETQLNVTLEATADGILAVDIQGRVIKANRRFANLWQIPQSLLDSRDDQAMMALMQDQLCEPEAFQKKMQVLHSMDMEEMETLKFKDGRILECYYLPILTEGLIAGWVWSFRDITERRRAEKEHEKLQAQFAQAQKMESIGRLAGGVAHDFNNMLSVILGSAEMEQLDPSDPLCVNFKEIAEAGRRSARLTQQLLAFARKQTVTPEMLDLNTTVTDMLTMLQRLIGENIELEWLPGTELWPVKLDASQVDQVLANLCVNARDAIAGIGHVTIVTQNRMLDAADCANAPGTNPGAYVLLSVRDSGCGMDETTRSHLFEPFFTTKNLGEGTGLGLSTVYGIVAQNNGLITVNSAPGNGTTFNIFFPRHLGKPKQVTQASSTAPVLRGHETVLLVEDEPSILRLSQRILERGGYQVVMAATPGEAIRLAEEHAGDIHLLITDVIMPEMNGRDLAKRLLVLYPNMRCLFMSGYTSDIIAHQGVIDAKMNFLQKPFTASNLTAKVDAILSKI